MTKLDNKMTGVTIPAAGGERDETQMDETSNRRGHKEVISRRRSESMLTGREEEDEKTEEGRGREGKKFTIRKGN